MLEMGQFKDQSLATWLTRRAQDVAMNRLALLLAIALLGPSCRVQGAATTADPGNMHAFSSLARLNIPFWGQDHETDTVLALICS